MDRYNLKKKQVFIAIRDKDGKNTKKKKYTLRRNICNVSVYILQCKKKKKENKTCCYSS